MGRRYFTLFEHRRQPLASKNVFLRRMVKCVWIAGLMLAASILLGATVYHYVEGFSWVNALLNAVLVMTGLGLTDSLHTTAGRLFTCFYAIIAAIVFYSVLAIIFTPLIHRFLHEFHLELEQGQRD